MKGVPRVAIFGSSGQLGTELASVLAARGCETACFDRASVDITEQAAVARAVGSYQPAVVLNAAAYNQVDVAEREPVSAYRTNGLAVRNLAIACRDTGARLVHFSTDYVFDGQTGEPYREDDPPHPLGAYAVSKLAGELYARAYLDQVLIVRTSGVFGAGGLATARGNFVELMLRLAAGSKPIRVVEDHVASPTYAPALASRTADLLEAGIAGIVHVGGGTPISWYDWAVMIFRAAGLSPNLTPVGERDFPTTARRPKYSALSNAKMESLGLARMPPLEQAIGEYLQARAERLSAKSA